MLSGYGALHLTRPTGLPKARVAGQEQLSILVLILAMLPVAHAQEGGIESLKQTGKAFALVARKVSPSATRLA